MAAKRTQYQIVGRYLCGVEVTGYHLQSMDTGKAGKYTREQVCYLVGRDQVTNCTGQIYQDKVLLRGKGMSLEDLPAVNEKGDMKNTEAVGKVRKGTSVESAMEQFMIVGTIKRGKVTEGYTLQNAGGATKRGSRAQVLELAKQGKIGNARVQMYQGKTLLRGVGCNLNDLPCEQLEDADSSEGNKSSTNTNSDGQDKHVKILLKLMMELNSKCGTGFDINNMAWHKGRTGRSGRVEDTGFLAKYSAVIALVLTHNNEINVFIESTDSAENAGGAGTNYRKQLASYGSGTPIENSAQYGKVKSDICKMIKVTSSKLLAGDRAYTA